MGSFMIIGRNGEWRILIISLCFQSDIIPSHSLLLAPPWSFAAGDIST